MRGEGILREVSDAGDAASCACATAPLDEHGTIATGMRTLAAGIKWNHTRVPPSAQARQSRPHAPQDLWIQDLERPKDPSCGARGDHEAHGTSNLGSKGWMATGMEREPSRAPGSLRLALALAPIAAAADTRRYEHMIRRAARTRRLQTGSPGEYLGQPLASVAPRPPPVHPTHRDSV